MTSADSSIPTIDIRIAAIKQASKTGRVITSVQLQLGPRQWGPGISEIATKYPTCKPAEIKAASIDIQFLCCQVTPVFPYRQVGKFLTGNQGGMGLRTDRRGDCQIRFPQNPIAVNPPAIDIVIGNTVFIFPGNQIFANCYIVGDRRIFPIVVAIPGDCKIAAKMIAAVIQELTVDIPGRPPTPTVIFPDKQKSSTILIAGNLRLYQILIPSCNGEFTVKRSAICLINTAIDIVVTIGLFLLPGGQIMLAGRAPANIRR